jgi:hypothetical protein
VEHAEQNCRDWNQDRERERAALMEREQAAAA